MFTDGLDNSALNGLESPRIDPILNKSSSSRGLGLPPPGKFRSGHLPPSSIPSSRIIPGDDSASVSDNDITSESEDEDVYGGRYSLDSSPQDDHRGPPSMASNYRYSNTRSLPPTRMSYGSDYLSSDVYSSVELSGKRGERLSKGNERYPVAQNGYADYDSEDSAASSDFSSSQVGSNVRTASRSQVHTSEGYVSSVTSKMNVGRMMVILPSAPPVCSSGHDNIQGVPEAQSKVYVDPHGASEAQSKVYVDSHGASSKEESNFPSVTPSGANEVDNTANKIQNPHSRTTGCAESAGSSGSHAARLPTFHARYTLKDHGIQWLHMMHVFVFVSMLGQGVAWKLPSFLKMNVLYCGVLLVLQQLLLQSEEEIMGSVDQNLQLKEHPEPKKMIGKMKVQVLDLSRLQLWSLLDRSCPRRFFVTEEFAYVQASTQYIKQVSGLLKVGVVTTLRHSASSYEPVQESHSCSLRLKSSPEDDAVRMQPGSGETHVFFPDGLGDDLIIEVQDSKGKTCGRVVSQVATIADDPNEKLRWWSIFHEPEHELVGKIQLYINFSMTSEENNNNKCGSVAETVAYDLVLEIAMKVQHFQQRHLLLHGEWK
ncbi:Hemin import ATP-binding protein HmuV [Bienertia sinuspersici]